MTASSDVMIVRVGCTFEYEATAACPAVFQIRPERSTSTDVRKETWESQPLLGFHDYLDLYGNNCRRLTIPAGHFAVNYDAEVAVSASAAPEDRSARQHPVEELPDDVLIYTVASRFCLSDEVADDAWELFGSAPPGWACVQAICDWVHGNVRFHYTETNPRKTAIDVLATKTGVCRDFAHLAITFCRALSIPARYVFGYLPDIDVPPPESPMDFCAWFEAFLGGRWWTFDPRNNQRRKGNIVVGRGRDALDVAMVTTYGAAAFGSMTVWADRVG
jgi:transglutaminase-like putative cysteine protease